LVDTNRTNRSGEPVATDCIVDALEAANLVVPAPADTDGTDG
jgi:hypothetical protein